MTATRLADRAVLRIAGADGKSFLQGLLTNDVDSLGPDRPLYAGLLSPQGKALFDMILHADGDDVLIDIAANRAQAFARRLSMYKLRKAVTITPTTLGVFAGWAGDAAGHPPDPRLAALGARWIAETGPEGADEAYTAHRLAHGVPDSIDIGEDQLLWLETGADLLNGVSFTKGCYVGQENTARMHHRDKVRRRLVPLRIEGEAAGIDVTDSAGRSVGTLRSRHGVSGIAHMRVEAADGPLHIGTATATVERPAWLAPAFAGAA